MKKLLALPVFGLMLCSASLHAQVADEMAGESYTYYDTLTRKKVKEIFHHKQVVTILPDPKHYGEYLDTTMYVRNGAYMMYYENGKLQAQGNYKEDKKEGTWTWYDPSGKVVKTEKYVNGKLAK